jgi:hypothetical protein
LESITVFQLFRCGVRRPNPLAGGVEQYRSKSKGSGVYCGGPKSQQGNVRRIVFKSVMRRPNSPGGEKP